MKDILERIHIYSLEEIMGDRFGRYSKSIIQDRAIPDVRDGLKPVQRRILYSMYREKHTYDKPTVKSARCVGDIMGKYHPHGDSSIYDAMVRMSQWWKQNACLIDMQGNNGSMDGDPPAAMRYTEAKLSKISNELVNKDLDKDTVSMAPNFDDTLLEPTVLPARFPNLLVNGSTGISAGYATNIPPHNLGEIIDATIKRIDSPNCYLDTILDIVKGPDFPTGGIVGPKKGIIDAFTKGRGKITIKSRFTVEKNKGKDQIVITEIPFEVNKQLLIQKINEIRIDKKIDGIVDARDESGREDTLRIVIDLKKDANTNLIIKYLLKNTDMQISYSYNMVAIVNKRPMTLGILKILDAYIAHQKEVTIRSLKYDLRQAEDELHIVEGLLKALSILDEVIKTIRASKNKSDAKNNLVKEFAFTERQAEAIVVLQLYRLTNTDVTEFIEKKNNLETIIKGIKTILEDENKLKNHMKEALRKVKKEYAVERKTTIVDEIEEVKIEEASLIPKEDVMVVCTNEGYIKRVSLRSYNEDEETLLKDGDFVTGLYEMNTRDTLLLFTDLGNYLYIPVHEIPDLKWKELGKHVSNIIPVGARENIIYSMPVKEFTKDKYITIFTKNGMVKRSLLEEFKVVRYSKPITAIKLKEDDLVVSVTNVNANNTFVATKRGYGLLFDTLEIPVAGLKASGVKSINLKDDEVVSGSIFDDNKEYITILTHKGTGKRIKIKDFEKSTRARRGLQIIREVKTNPYYIVKIFIINSKKEIKVLTNKELFTLKPVDLPIADRYSVGSSITKDEILLSFTSLEEETESVEKEVETKEEILSRIDEKIYTIEDFLDDIDK